VMIEGKMQDDATYKQCRVMVDYAKRIARKDPEYREAYGFADAELEGLAG
jgi:malyl-CoA/(S)-citramalyl-CoA lyase